jgi:hypothetical protein
MMYNAHMPHVKMRSKVSELRVAASTEVLRAVKALHFIATVVPVRKITFGFLGDTAFMQCAR